MRTYFNRLLLGSLLILTCGSCDEKYAVTIPLVADMSGGHTDRHAEICIQFEGETDWRCS